MRRFVFSLTAVQPHRQHKLARLWSQGRCLQHLAASCVLIFLFGEWTVICFHWPIASVAECRITLMGQNLRDTNFLFHPSSALPFLVPFTPLVRAKHAVLAASTAARRGMRMLQSCLNRLGQGWPRVSKSPQNHFPVPPAPEHSSPPPVHLGSPFQ